MEAGRVTTVGFYRRQGGHKNMANTNGYGHAPSLCLARSGGPKQDGGQPLLRSVTVRKLRWVLIAACGTSLLGASACSYGAVFDAQTGTGIQSTRVQGATLAFQALNMSSPVTHTSVPVALGPSVRTRTWASTDTAPHAGYDGTNWLNPYAPENAGDTTPTVVTQGWNRITLNAQGFDTMYVYRNHQYVPTTELTPVPYSAGPYAVPVAGTAPGASVSAAAELFGIWRTPIVVPLPSLPFGPPTPPLVIFDHQKLPDLIIDPRSLLQVQQVLAGCGPALPDRIGYCSPSTDSTLTSNTKQCLTFSVNFVNVGMDNFEVYADPGPSKPITASTLVQQVIYSSVASPQKVATTGKMQSGGAGTDAEVEDFAQFDLRGPIVTGVCDTEPTATACPIVSLNGGAVAPSLKDVCLGANTSQFDPIYGPPHGGLRTLGCHLTGTSSIGDEGLPAGFGEMYPVGQDCGFLDISNVPPGTYWLEGEINPADASGNRTYQESDYTNNISRVMVSVGGEATCPCSQVAGGNSANRCLGG